MAMSHNNAQEIQDILGRKITSLGIDGRNSLAESSLTFLGNSLKSYHLNVAGNNVTKVSFSLEEKNHSDLLKKVKETFGKPSLGLESGIMPHFKPNENEGTFEFGKVSSKEFVFDADKIEDYIYLIWNAEAFLIHYYKPQTALNDSNDIRIEIIAR